MNLGTLAATIAAIMLGAPALAATIHLTCNETEVIKHNETINTAGRVSTPTKSIKPLKGILVMISPDQGNAKVWHSEYSLTVYPTRYELRNIPQKDQPSDSIINMSNTFKINRETLEMRYSESIQSIQWGRYIRQSTKSEREAVGTCKI